MNLALFALALSAFGIGTTEFVIMGILPQVGNSLHVSIPAAGLLVSFYALGVAVGAPILAILTKSFSRKKALLILMLIFILGNIFCALSFNYTEMMIARIVTSFCHGSFFGIGAVVAAGLVAPQRRASAVALMFTGLTLANVVGVPFGTWIAQHWEWHITFWLIAGIGVLAFLALLAFLPDNGASEIPVDFKAELKVVRQPHVLLAMLITMLTFASVFALFTYIAPILLDTTKTPQSWITVTLLIIGVGSVIGNLWGGKLADKGILSALMITIGFLFAISLIFTFTSISPYLAVITLFFWGVASFSTVAPLQMNVVKSAHAAPNIASTINIGVFNIGNAIGAYLGGVPLSMGFGPRSCIIVALGLAVLAILATILKGILAKTHWQEHCRQAHQ
ncbi:MAG: MFS transporter [Gammaproteobacteria bacterium]|jgi:DHA1 family inner membrane transport protein|nr:MFS transporter [Gammaproteobacteria bacterium]